MKLTLMDKISLNGMGFTEKDYKQIETACILTTYQYQGKRISRKKTIDLLGRYTWLSGIGRSAFHWSACRPCDAGIVYFDSSKLFEV